MDTMVRQSREGGQTSTHRLKDNRIDPVLRNTLNILFVISFLKEQMKSLGGVLLCNPFLSTVTWNEENIFKTGKWVFTIAKEEYFKESREERSKTSNLKLYEWLKGLGVCMWGVGSLKCKNCKWFCWGRKGEWLHETGFQKAPLQSPHTKKDI